MLEAIENGNQGDVEAYEAILDKLEENIAISKKVNTKEFMKKIDKDLAVIGNILQTQEDRSQVIDERVKANVIEEIIVNIKQSMVAEYQDKLDAENEIRRQKGQRIKTTIFNVKMFPVNVQQEILEQATKIADNYIRTQQEEHKFSEYKEEQMPAIYDPNGYQEGASSMGKGMTSTRIKTKVHPKYTVIKGRGVSIKEEPKFIELGNFVISIPHYNNGILKLKYSKTGQDVLNLTTRMNEDMNEFIDNFLDTQKINTKMFNKLSSEDKQFFKRLINKSGLSVKYKSKELSSKEEDQENERFNLCKSEFIAGNDNKNLIKELKSFLLKFMNDGRISKKEGNDLLYHLSL